MDDSAIKQFTILEHIINNNKIPHALLFEVDDNETGLLIAKKISKLLLCRNHEKKIDLLNCSLCNICNLIDNDNYPDLKIISADGNWIKKQQLIDLQNEFNNKSLLDNKRIYIINEADKLNSSSSNSLLKFLEEPEDDIIAILLTKNRYLLLDTMISRCQIFNFKKSDYQMNSDYLDDVTRLIEYFVNQRNMFLDYKFLFEEVFVDKQKTNILLTEVEKYLLLFMLGMTNKDNLYNKLNNVSLEKVTSYIKIIESEKQKLEYNVNFKLWLDSFYSRVIGEVYD